MAEDFHRGITGNSTDTVWIQLFELKFDDVIKVTSGCMSSATCHEFFTKIGFKPIITQLIPKDKVRVPYASATS